MQYNNSVTQRERKHLYFNYQTGNKSPALPSFSSFLTNGNVPMPPARSVSENGGGNGFIQQRIFGGGLGRSRFDSVGVKSSLVE